MRRVLVVLLCLVCAFPFQVFASENAGAESLAPVKVIFSEIMANPLDESTGEFIELHNAGEMPVDLAGWIVNDLVDAKDTVKDYTGSFDIGLSGTVLAPHTFALLVDSDYAGQYNDIIETHADLSSLIMITIDDTTLGNGLGNTSDTLTLTSDDGVYHTTHSWSSDTANGFSWSGYGLGTASEIWKKSAQTEGTSAGFTNNLAPEAALTLSSETGEAPLEIHFDASDSFDPEGLALTYSMDFGDGTFAPVQGSPLFTHSYIEPGTPTATLTVTDSEQTTATIQKILTITPHVVVPPCSLKVSEILPNPAGDDTTSEFIEIQNTGSTSCNLAGYQLDDSEGGSSPYVFPSTTVLAAHAFLATYSNTTHITLNNTADSARVLDSANVAVDTVAFSDSKEAQSYAWDDTKYTWTTTLTPNTANTITKEEESGGNTTPDPSNTEPDDVLELSSIRDAKKLEDNDNVLVEGYVTAKAGTLSSQYMYIHDETSGIQIYSSKKLFPNIKLGQKVRVTGNISKTSNLTRILIHQKEDIEVLTPTKIFSSARRKTGKISPQDEGELISVSGKIIKKLGTSAIINDGTGDLTISFRYGSGLKPSSVTTGSTATLQGIITVSNDQVQLLPRATSDVVLATTLKGAKLPEAGSNTAPLIIMTTLFFLGYVLLQFRLKRSSPKDRVPLIQHPQKIPAKIVRPS